MKTILIIVSVLLLFAGSCTEAVSPFSNPPQLIVSPDNRKAGEEITITIQTDVDTFLRKCNDSFNYSIFRQVGDDWRRTGGTFGSCTGTSQLKLLSSETITARETITEPGTYKIEFFYKPENATVFDIAVSDLFEVSPE